MAEESGVEDINGKTKELAVENGDCDEDEKGILFNKALIVFWYKNMFAFREKSSLIDIL